MLLGALEAIVETILPKKLKDVSGEIVLVSKIYKIIDFIIWSYLAIKYD